MSDHNMMGHDMSSHTNMDHSMPGHDMPGNGGDHSGHSSPMCKMNMLFTWDYENVCVVFKWWHIYNAFDLVLSVIAIAVLAAGYEFLKYRYKQFVRKNRGFKGLPISANTPNVYLNKVPQNFRLKHSLLYGFQVGYSFMLMLVFMSFNGWLMTAVVAGAVIGNFVWNDLNLGVVVSENDDGNVNASQESLEGESMACH